MQVLKNASAKLFGPGSLSIKMQSPTKKSSGFWRRHGYSLLKWGLFVVNVAYLYITLSKNASLFNLLNELGQVFSGMGTAAAIFGLCAFLTLVNWGLEAQKWRQLIKRVQKINFADAYKAVLSGAAVSFWIPNRSGEYLGRIFVLKRQVRLRGVLATLVGSLAQLCVTIIFGVAGLAFYVSRQTNTEFIWYIAAVFGAALILLLLLAYFNVDKVKMLLPETGWLSKFKKYLRVYSFFSRRDLLKVLAFSAARYTVFSLQFVLLLKLYGVEIGVLPALFTVFLIYLVQTVYPSTALTELGIRGSASLHFFGAFTTQQVAILSATYTLWFINLLLPGALGLIILAFLRSRDKKEK